MSNISNAKSLLQKYFKYQDFRPDQKAPIKALLEEDKNILVLMPTGGGKSLLYTIPALVYNGLTIVVSPLVALMENQVITLKSKGIDADYLSSSHNILNKIKKNLPKILFVSPERFVDDNFSSWLKTVDISLIALDEAHTYTQFGLSFRFTYRNFFKKLKEFNVQFLAVTATASPFIFNDLTNSYKFDEIFKFPVKRDNIFLSFKFFNTEKEKENAFFSDFKDKGSQIIYCVSRRNTQKIFYNLNDKTKKLAFYHAKLNSERKKDVLIKFLNDEYKHISATTAFGMGIDKGDIDTVFHFEIPYTIEDYTQQVGRAGRDGSLSKGVAFISFEALLNRYNNLLYIPSEKEFINSLKNIETNSNSLLSKLIYNQMILEEIILVVDKHHCFIDQINETALKYPKLNSILKKIKQGENYNISSLAQENNLTQKQLLEILGYLKEQNILKYTINKDEFKNIDKEKLYQSVVKTIIQNQKDFMSLIEFIFTPKCRNKWLSRFYGDDSEDCTNRCDNCSDPDKAEVYLNQKINKKKYLLKKLLQKNDLLFIKALIDKNYKLKVVKKDIYLIFEN